MPGSIEVAVENQSVRPGIKIPFGMKLHPKDLAPHKLNGIVHTRFICPIAQLFYRAGIVKNLTSGIGVGYVHNEPVGTHGRKRSTAIHKENSNQKQNDSYRREWKVAFH